MTRKRIIALIVAIAIVIVASLTVWFIYRAIYSATINVYFAPKSASISIGTGGGRFGDNYVKPGTYKVLITKQGFTSYSQEVTIKAGETVVVEGSLDPSSTETADWYANNLEDYAIAQEIGDRKADQARERLLREYPIVKDLPIIGLYSAYRVDYGISPTKPEKTAIIIRYQSETAKQAAIREVRAKGYDLTKYEVVYKLDAPTQQGLSFVGISALSQRGVSKAIVDRVKALFIAEYVLQTADDTTATVTFAERAGHVLENGGAKHTYTVNYTVSGQSERRLTIIVINVDNLEIAISAPNGSQSKTLYTGKV